ncbi:MAG: fibronectin type III domain-containing protein, partial [Oscillospiraceae bacterium]|nr:fibronectin type III domain-containing protein [Oscillospiraceae bacterium]
NITKAEKTTEGYVKLTWTVSGTQSGITYRVYRSTTRNARGTKLKEGLTGKTYTDNKVGKGLFYYQVVPYDTILGVEYEASPQFAVVTASSPLVTKIEPGNGKMNVSWEAVSGATKYVVYYKTGTSTKKIERAASQTGAYIGGIANGTYKVWVKAVVNGKETTETNKRQTTVKGYYVNCKTQAVESGGILISWDAFPNAIRYRVVCIDKDNNVRDTKTTSKLEFKWLGLHNGEDYGFYVQPFITKGGYPTASNNGVYPTFTRTDAKDKPYIKWTVPVNAPMIKKLSLGNKKVWLYYESVPRATKYYIYYRQKGQTKDTLAGTTTQPKFLVTGLANNTPTEFYVKALVDGKLTPLKRPATRSTKNGLKPTVSAMTGGKATVKWSKYSDQNGAATKYQVVLVDANNKIINTRDYATTETVWTGLTKGTKYGFYVVPYVNGEYIPFGRSYAEDKANIVFFTAK